MKKIFQIKTINSFIKNFWLDISHSLKFRKKVKIFNFFDQRDIGSIPRTVISSVFVIVLFYFTPIIIKKKNNFFIFKSWSKFLN